MRVLSIFLLAASLGLAQSPLPLSMKRAVEIALAPDGSTRAALAQESIQQAKDRVAEARPRFCPTSIPPIRENRQTTNLKAYGFAFNIPVPGFSIPTIVGPFDVFDARASAQQSVLNFSDVRKYQASKATLAATKFDNDATRSQVSDEVARAYLACLRADADRDTGARQRGIVARLCWHKPSARRPRAPAPASKSLAPKCSSPTTASA